MPFLHAIRALQGLDLEDPESRHVPPKMSLKPKMAIEDSKEDSIEPHFPTKQLAYLALCRIAEPVALTSVFPYSYSMMQHMPSPISHNAAFYSGIFIAAFPFAETITAFMWGSLSDRIGRKPVLLIGCIGTLISLLIMGFASSFWIAILGRLLGGGLNGNIGTVQSMVGDLVTEPRFEGMWISVVVSDTARAYAIMPFFFAVGCTIGPTIGGSFARPAETWPDTFGHLKLFIDFPYLLPNLFCATFLAVTIIFAAFLLEESHPRILEERKQEKRGKYLITDERSKPLIPDLEGEQTHSYGSIKTASKQELLLLPTPSSLTLGWKIWNPIIASCLLAGHTLSYFQLLPIFLQMPLDPLVPPNYPLGIGGLSLPIPTTGHILGFAGLLNLLIQSLFFPYITTLFSLPSIFLFVTTLHPLAYFLLPYIAFIPASSPIIRMAVLYIWIGSRTICSTFAFPILLIFVRRATPHSGMLGRVNGLVASSQAGFRTAAPAVAGWLQGVGEENHFSALAWWGAGVVALVGAVQGGVVVRGFKGDGLV